MKHNFEISYIQQGDYLLPDLRLPEQPKVKIGIWGKRHLRYIEQHHKILYTDLLTSCKLTAYLADIDEQAEEMFFRLLKQLSEKGRVTEKIEFKKFLFSIFFCDEGIFLTKLPIICQYDIIVFDKIFYKISE